MGEAARNFGGSCAHSFTNYSQIWLARVDDLCLWASCHL